MRYFLKSVATSKITLPVVCVLVVVVLIAQTPPPDSLVGEETGLWYFLPLQTWLSQWARLGIRVGLMVLSVFLLAELNNSFVLLRVRSRMISALYALLIMASVTLHPLQPASVVAPIIISAYFLLFGVYQISHAVYPTFFFFLLVSLCSLVSPKFLFMTPIFWACLIHLRAFSFKVFLASIMGLLIPYWFLFLYSLAQMDELSVFRLPLQQLCQLPLPDYSVVSLSQWLVLACAFLLFLVGWINFVATAYLDKTRVRITYNIVIIVGVAAFLLVALQPQCFNSLFILCVIHSAILSGRYFAQDESKFANILFIILMVFLVLVTIYNHFGQFLFEYFG